MTGIADKIMERVSSFGPGTWVCTPKDFIDLASREAVDQALSRLVKANRLRRVGHGLYDLPRFSEFLNKYVPADMDAVVEAIVRRDGIRVMPGGMAPANQLGLTNAVAAKAVYTTDGPSRTIKVGRRTLVFRHASPRIMRWAGRPGGRVVEALRWLGPDIVAAERGYIVSKLRSLLPDYVKNDLLNNSRDLPGWALPVVLDVVKDDPKVT